MRYIYLFIVLLLCLDLHSQINVSHELEIIDAQGQEYIDTKLTYENTDSITYSLWINTWRIIVATNTDEKIFGVPYMSNLVNFLFITPIDYDFDKYFDSQTEFENLGDLYSNRIKILKPREKFVIHLIIKDKSVISFVRNNKFKVSYIYGICPYEKMYSVLNIEEKDTYSSSDLVLANIPILENKIGSNTRGTFFYFMEGKKIEINISMFNNIFEKRYYNIKK